MLEGFSRTSSDCPGDDSCCTCKEGKVAVLNQWMSIFIRYAEFFLVVNTATKI